MVVSLHAIHFVLADDLDADLTVLARQVAGPVNVAEGAVAHLLKKFPPFEAGVLGELALAGVLLGDEFGQVGLVDTLALGGILLRHVLCGLGIVSSGMIGLGDTIA